MTFIDTSIFMYAAGKEHPNKEPSGDRLKLVSVGEVDAVINVEVLQEIFHRYTMIKMKSKGIELAKKVITIVPRNLFNRAEQCHKGYGNTGKI